MDCVGSTLLCIVNTRQPFRSLKLSKPYIKHKDLMLHLWSHDFLCLGVAYRLLVLWQKLWFCNASSQAFYQQARSIISTYLTRKLWTRPVMYGPHQDDISSTNNIKILSRENFEGVIILHNGDHQIKWMPEKTGMNDNKVIPVALSWAGKRKQRSKHVHSFIIHKWHPWMISCLIHWFTNQNLARWFQSIWLTHLELVTDGRE